MKNLFFAFGCAAILAATTNHLAGETQVALTQGTSGSWNVDWNGATERTDFLQWSTDLIEWHWAPLVEYHTGAKSYGFISSTEKYFLRLQHAYIPSSDPEGDDYDYDDLTNIDEVTLHDTDPLNWDTDGDGMEDSWEINNFLDPRDNGSIDPDNGPDGDPDNDGLPNLFESWYGSNPHLAHSDNDGINDGDEVFFYNTSPTLDDSDYDGLNDFDELNVHGTDPNKWDSDEDTLNDGSEITVHATNPLKMDTDGDWMWDDWELNHQLDPNNSADGLLDADSDGLLNQLEFVFRDDGFDAFTPDAANFPWNGDPDYDGMTTAIEFNTHLTNPKQSDTDDDGMDDGWEIGVGFNARLHNSQDANPNNDENADPDGDNLTNGAESGHQTNPYDEDSDGDGVNDDVEINQGTNPNDPNDHDPPPGGTTTVNVEFGDFSDSHSEKYRVKLQPVEGDTQVRQRSNRKYGQTQTDTFHLPKGAKYTISLVHIGTDPKYRDDPKPDYDYLLEIDDSANGLTVEDPQGIMGYHGESDSFFASGKTATLRVPLFEWITPKGSPVSAPDDAGDGQNEFTYNTSNPGVMTMDLKVLVKPTGTAGVTDRHGVKFSDRCFFKLPTITGSNFAWDAANTDGKSSDSGEHLIAKATYTNLPTNNTDFGLKQAEFSCDGDDSILPKNDFEVFYPATEKNHAGGDPAHPNWFHYYRQNEGGTDYTYDPILLTSRTQSGVPNSIQIADNAYSGGDYITTTMINGSLFATGRSGTFKYYRYFYSVVVHERHHANNELTVAASIPPQDTDGDSLPDTYETATTHTDPGNAFSASPQSKDDEVYAGGPIEEAANQAADTSQDWANPGTNSK